MSETFSVVWEGISFIFDVEAGTVNLSSSDQTELNIDEIWDQFRNSDVCLNDPILHELANHSTLKRSFGTSGDDNFSSSLNGGIYAGDGNDVITVTAQNGTGQFHTFAQSGNDTTNLDFGTITKYSHGHHARGGSGENIFNFTNINNVSHTIVGRIEDFDYSRDTIKIGGQTLDFENLPVNVRLVEYNGDHNDNTSDSQLWILITTESGGRIFYALDGARIDMNGDGGANSGDQEAHFVSIPDDFNFEDLTDVEFFDKQNYVPDGFSPDGGIIINDVDTVAADVLDKIFGTIAGDLIAAGLNDDVVDAGSGNDIVWGGNGHDLINGQRGHDVLIGGTGNDIVNGGGGRDEIYGGRGNDLLDGGKGQDKLYGEGGNDEIIGGKKNDRLDGGDGDDILNGGKDNDVLIGGNGRDVFVFKESDGIDKIRDFEDGVDLISIWNLRFEDLTITESNNQVVVWYGVSDAIYINNIELGDLTEADFVFS
jgi:Ca2+-binding RTX toxin-like protein